MKNPAYKILLLGSLALFLNSCIKPDPSTEKGFLESLETPVKPDASDKPNPPSKQEVFKGYVFKPYLNDYFSSDNLKQINNFYKQAKKFIASKNSPYNDERKKICLGNKIEGVETFFLPEQLNILNNDCNDKIKWGPSLEIPNLGQITNLVQMNISSINVFDSSIDTDKPRIKNKNTPFIKKAFKDVTTPYIKHNLEFRLQPVDKNQPPLTFADLIAITQKFVNKYLDQKLGDNYLLSYKEVRDTYKKMFATPLKNPRLYFGEEEIDDINDTSWLSTIYTKNGYIEKGRIYRKNNVSLYAHYYSKSDLGKYSLALDSCGKSIFTIAIDYDDSQKAIKISIINEDINPHNLFFKYAQSSKPLEKGGVMPATVFNKIHNRVGNVCGG